MLNLTNSGVRKSPPELRRAGLAPCGRRVLQVKFPVRLRAVRRGSATCDDTCHSSSGGHRRSSHSGCGGHRQCAFVDAHSWSSFLLEVEDNDSWRRSSVFIIVLEEEEAEGRPALRNLTNALHQHRRTASSRAPLGERGRVLRGDWLRAGPVCFLVVNLRRCSDADVLSSRRPASPPERLPVKTRNPFLEEDPGKQHTKTCGSIGIGTAMAFRKALKRTAIIGGGAVATVFGLSQLIEYRKKQARLAHVAAEAELRVPFADELPSRQAQLAALQNTEEFDVLVVGGGATGVGCALDAVTRNLRTALVERSDFSSGTSSRSTKLIHGGVRYLQKAVMQLDYEQYMMVKEALHERANLLEIAPHLSAPLPIMLPVYKWWQLPYYWAGIKMYDLVAGIQCLKSSYVLSKTKALELFPMLKKDKLVGAIVYYDGQHNDARMNLAIGLTAARYGAAVANYTEVVHLLKTKDPQTGEPKVCGARCRDIITGKEFDVKAKCVINATGPFTDSLRKMDNQESLNICQPSAGVHIVIPGYYSPDNMGLLDPATSDGRVIFFLPWEKVTIAGTTDTPTSVTAHPIPGEDDINFILREVRNYLSPDVEVRRGDVLAAWSGIRPLVTDPNSKDTQSICRNHIVSISDSGLVTIAGGKWTTYRSMAEETLDAAIEAHGLSSEPCKTVGLMLEGAKGWTPTLYIRLVQDYGLENEVAQHLASTYGGKAFDVAKMAQVTGQRWPIVGKRLVSEFPYIEAEVLYAMKEYACTAIDVIARRTRLGFLNVQAADEALPRIVQIMGKELDWSQERRTAELEAARKFLYHEMGYRSRSEQLTKTSEINLDYQEVVRYKKRFHKFDKESKGFITTVDVQQVLDSINVHIDENSLHEILNEVDLNKNGQVEIDEFLQLMSAVKKGQVSDSRLAILLKSAEETLDKRGPVTVDRSGGGV